MSCRKSGWKSFLVTKSAAPTARPSKQADEPSPRNLLLADALCPSVVHTTISSTSTAARSSKGRGGQVQQLLMMWRWWSWWASLCLPGC